MKWGNIIFKLKTLGIVFPCFFNSFWVTVCTQSCPALVHWFLSLQSFCFPFFSGKELIYLRSPENTAHIHAPSLTLLSVLVIIWWKTIGWGQIVLEVNFLDILIYRNTSILYLQKQKYSLFRLQYELVTCAEYLGWKIFGSWSFPVHRVVS